MMIIPDYKLTTLIHFIGEKKLKQVGLLACDTCAHILGETLNQGINNSPIMVEQVEDTLENPIIIEQVADIPETPSATEQVEDIPETPSAAEQVGDISETLSINEPTGNIIADSMTQLTENASHSLQEPLPLIEDSLELVEDDPLIYEDNAYLVPLAVPKEASLPCDPLGIGYSYYPIKKIPPYAIICSECGRLYTPHFSFHSLQPISTYLTPAQQEIIKGFYVDIIL